MAEQKEEWARERTWRHNMNSSSLQALDQLAGLWLYLERCKISLLFLDQFL